MKRECEKSKHPPTSKRGVKIFLHKFSSLMSRKKYLKIIEFVTEGNKFHKSLSSCHNNKTTITLNVSFSLFFLPLPFLSEKNRYFTLSYKTSLSSSSSPSSTSSRRLKSGLNSNKNKLLKDELSYNNKNDKNDMQLVSHSSYWPENVKRSQLENGNNNNIFGSVGDESEFNLKDYSLGEMPSSNDNSNSNNNNNNNDDEVMYDDDYDVNGFFDSVNQDNINDFYFYINHLLSKKPNQKTI